MSLEPPSGSFEKDSNALNPSFVGSLVTPVPGTKFKSLGDALTASTGSAATCPTPSMTPLPNASTFAVIEGSSVF